MHKLKIDILSLILVTILISFNVLSESSIEIHDAHIHYDEDLWKVLPVANALKMLKDQNISRVMVSATPTEGAEMLYRAAPDLVIPMLRPYRSWRHRYFWFKDPALKSYLLEHLDRVPYRGFGEFHVFGKDADTAPIDDMISLARKNKLVLHPHTDLEGMRILLNKASDLVVIWAHGGFDVALDDLLEALDRYPRFYIELSFREGMLDEQGRLRPQWKTILIKYRTRFLVGMDTYKPSRWANLPEIAATTRDWLMQLPDDVAADIARNNLDRLLPQKEQSSLD